MSFATATYAPYILRFGVVVVLAWFSFEQLTNPTGWEVWVPAWATGLSGLSASTIVILNGWFEAVLAVCLALGLYTRVVALVVALHWLTLVLDIGVTPVGVRDFGLAMMALALAALGGERREAPHAEA